MPRKAENLVAASTDHATGSSMVRLGQHAIASTHRPSVQISLAWQCSPPAQIPMQATQQLRTRSAQAVAWGCVVLL
jgi:hypothetical protein